MSVAVEPDVIRLGGRCLVEDAESLLTALQDHPGTQVDVAGVQKLHLAVAQVLLATGVEVIGLPENPVLARLLPDLLR